MSKELSETDIDKIKEYYQKAFAELRQKCNEFVNVAEKALIEIQKNNIIAAISGQEEMLNTILLEMENRRKKSIENMKCQFGDLSPNILQQFIDSTERTHKMSVEAIIKVSENFINNLKKRYAFLE